jgi:hypothetical protein
MIRYAAMAMTGLNDPSAILKCVDDAPCVWSSFADAKGAAAARAEILHEYLDSSGCGYHVLTKSGSHHYEVAFEYGPTKLEVPLPFKMVFHVYRCAVVADRSSRPTSDGCAARVKR